MLGSKKIFWPDAYEEHHKKLGWTLEYKKGQRSEISKKNLNFALFK